MKRAKVKGKTIVVGVTGSVAAYKAAELVSTLRQQGAKVYVLLTPSAARFVGAATFQSLSENPVVSDLFQEIEGMTPTHIRLAEQADAFVVAPATANILAKMRYGLADEIVSCVYLATRAPVVVAPAMNCHMLEHPAVEENLRALRERGHTFVEPDTGFLACGYEGKGRLAPTQKIIEAIEAALKK